MEKQTPPPIVDERATSGIQQFLQANALQRNASFDAIGKNDPRRLALDWILYADSVQLDVQDKRLTQRYILALLAFAFDSMAWTVPNATGLEDTHSVWLSSTDECRWYGVSCHAGTVSGLVLSESLAANIPAFNFLVVSRHPLSSIDPRRQCADRRNTSRAWQVESDNL